MMVADTAVAAPARIVGGSVLINGQLVPAEVALAGGRIVDSAPGASDVDASGLLVLPGIIDLHGDAFERAICPRPGVVVPMGIALTENDAWLLSAGITTAFLSATDSFEPGLRSRETLRHLVGLLDPDAFFPLSCDTRLHVRHEVCLTDGHAELLDWMAQGRVHLLSTADHLPEDGDPVRRARFLKSVSTRSTLAATAIDELIARASAQRALGRIQEAELCRTALALRIPLASHDDHDEAAVAASLARGCGIVEFPFTTAVARIAQERRACVLLGAPNWVRGGSHLGLLSVAVALAAGVAGALCSDYHYPSLFHAAFLMAERQVMPLAEAWALVSQRPAEAAGLADKGRIATGFAADLILVEPTPRGPRLRSVWVAGREVARFA